MPRRPMRPCSVPGCRELVDRGRCDRHAKQVRTTQQERASAARRGYDKRWQRFRVWYLAEHPLCVDCERRGRITPALEVHHIAKVADRPDLRLVEANCMALCKACHQRRTARGE
jgi:5-methylcytosine-specific restriction enzyme A